MRRAQPPHGPALVVLTCHSATVAFVVDGCGFGTDMHAKDALHAGETQGTRLADAFNRANVIVRRPAGDYVAGQFG